MSQSAHPVYHSFREYIAFERASNVKHEYLEGQVYAMAGGTPEHAAIAANVVASLNAQLRGKGCRVFTSDLRVRVAMTGLTTYPDVSVVCGKLEVDPDDNDTVVNPVVLVEVLSRSTERYDRGEKFEHCRRIPTLREYLLVSFDKKQLEVRRREADGSWSVHGAADGGHAVLSSIGCELEVSEVYRDELAERGGA